MYLVGCKAPCGSSPHALSKLIYEVASKSLQVSQSSFMRFLPKKSAKAHLCGCFQKSSSQPCLLTRLDSGVSNMLKEERKLGEAKGMGEVCLLLLRSDARRVGHTEEKRRKRKERPFGHECDGVRNTLE